MSCDRSLVRGGPLVRMDTGKGVVLASNVIGRSDCSSAGDSPAILDAAEERSLCLRASRIVS